MNQNVLKLINPYIILVILFTISIFHVCLPNQLIQVVCDVMIQSKIIILKIVFVIALLISEGNYSYQYCVLLLAIPQIIIAKQYYI